jgi:glycosyltransferase involved in cell wall biosynthesis
MNVVQAPCHVAADRAPAPVRWHIITGEYPPQPGGVSDYTRAVARALCEAGDQVNVWAPPTDQPEVADWGVVVHRLPDRFGRRSLTTLSAQLDLLETPQRILVQYVPHAFGWRAANLPFCLWLRSRTRDSVWVMFHEVAFPFRTHGKLRHNALAAVNRTMASIVARAAERAFVSIPAWQGWVQSLSRPGTPVAWLPVPSPIPVAGDGVSAELSARQSDGRPLVGHFGTYGDAIRGMLEASIPRLMARSECRVLLMGRASDAARRGILAAHPEIGDRLQATGPLTPEALSRHIGACDLMFQPYPDGISTRRTSAMAALAHGRPMVTTWGHLSETIWAESGAVVLAPADDVHALVAAGAALIADSVRRAELSRRSQSLYAERFDVRHTVATLRSA